MEGLEFGVAIRRLESRRFCEGHRLEFGVQVLHSDLSPTLGVWKP